MGNENIKVYEPSEKILKVHNTFKNKDIILLEGAVRSGKSYTANILSLKYIQKIPPCSILVSGATVNTVKQNVINEWEKLFGIEFIIKRDLKGEYFTIPYKGYEGKYFYIRGRDKQTDFKKIQGMTLGFWYRDERVHHHQSFFNMRLSRLSQTFSKSILTCNPDNPYHYIKTDFIDKQYTDEEFSSYFQSFSFLITENPSLDKKYIMKQKSNYSGVYYDRMILGKWVLAEGLIYDSFDKSKHTKKYNKQEIDLLKNNPNGKIYIGIDYGTQNRTVFLKFVKIENKFYLIEEFYHSGRESKKQKSTSDYAQELKNFIGEDKIYKIYIDPSASYFKVEIQKIKIKGGTNRKNDVIDGIRNVQDVFNKNNIIIYDNCKDTIKELSTYSWDEKLSEKGEDKPQKVNDHTMDALRYVIYTTNKKTKIQSGVY